MTTTKTVALALATNAPVVMFYGVLFVLALGQVR